MLLLHQRPSFQSRTYWCSLLQSLIQCRVKHRATHSHWVPQLCFSIVQPPRGETGGMFKFKSFFSKAVTSCLVPKQSIKLRWKTPTMLLSCGALNTWIVTLAFRSSCAETFLTNFSDTNYTCAPGSKKALALWRCFLLSITSRVHKNKSMQHHTLGSGTAEFQVTWPPKLREGTYLVKNVRARFEYRKTIAAHEKQVIMQEKA